MKVKKILYDVYVYEVVSRKNDLYVDRAKYTDIYIVFNDKFL